VAGVTDKLPVGPTLPIPGVIPMAVALETSQLKVEDPRNMLGGVATKELIMGKPPPANTTTSAVAVIVFAPLEAVNVKSVVDAGITTMLPVKDPTEPIPGVIDISEAFETSHFKVEAPPAMIVPGIAENELTESCAEEVLGGFPDGAVGVVAGVVDDDGAFAGVEVPGEGMFM